MNFNRTLLFILFVIAMFCIPIAKLNAQITIGSGKPPAKGALLELKSVTPSNPDTDNSTSDTGGLLLPRVNLTDVAQLTPFIQNPTPEEKEELIGLLIFNMTTATNLKPGIYFWNGEEWCLLILHEV